MNALETPSPRPRSKQGLERVTMIRALLSPSVTTLTTAPSHYKRCFAGAVSPILTCRLLPAPALHPWGLGPLILAVHQLPLIQQTSGRGFTCTPVRWQRR